MIRINICTIGQPKGIIRVVDDCARFIGWTGVLKPVRILLAGMSNMLGSIVTAAIAQMPDGVVAGHVNSIEDLAPEIGSTGVNAVIVQTNRPEAVQTFAPLLRSFPALRVVAIDGTGTNGYVHRLCPCSARIPELSVRTLQSALLRDSAPDR
jgi:hypothetical protein